MLSAIDQAVKDGVDILSMSITGTINNLDDPVQVAFKNAAAADIFVAVSAGNGNPATDFLNHPSPWLTSVAASTLPRYFFANAVLGDNNTYQGGGLFSASPVGPYPLVLSDSAGLAGVNASQVLLCYRGSLDPAKVQGKIVVCDRGGNDRVQKSAAVKEAGGLGMILVNTPNTGDDVPSADRHAVPSVHLAKAYRDAVRAYASSAAAPTASLVANGISYDVKAPLMAPFSLMGPTAAAGREILKPDITAPGAAVWLELFSM
eukprot:gene4962-5203_t